jgi:hypothetical protein
MWSTIQSIIDSRSSLAGKKQELERFACKHHEQFHVLGKEFGDDLCGLWPKEELYVNSYYMDDFITAFKKVLFIC